MSRSSALHAALKRMVAADKTLKTFFLEPEEGELELLTSSFPLLFKQCPSLIYYFHLRNNTVYECESILSYYEDEGNKTNHKQQHAHAFTL